MMLKMTKSEVTSGKSEVENPLPREICARERTGKWLRTMGKRLHKCEMTKSEVTSGKSDLENPLPREICARERTGKRLCTLG